MVPGNFDPECGSAQFFGAALRALREQKEIALGEMAAKVGMSTPYLCNIELGKFPPPSEEKLRSIAHELGHDSDELLAKAGKTASDLSVIINKYPRQFAAILRSLRKFRESDFQVLVNGLAQQFKPDAVPADPPWSATRKEKTHAQIPVDWKLLVKAFAE